MYSTERSLIAELRRHPPKLHVVGTKYFIEIDSPYLYCKVPLKPIVGSLATVSITPYISACYLDDAHHLFATGTACDGKVLAVSLKGIMYVDP